MPTPMYDRRKVVLAKIETTYGTDSVPTAGANALLVRDLKIMPLELNYAERKLIRPAFGNFQQLPTTQMVKLQIEQELAGSGAMGTAPPAGMDALLRACGLSGTNNPGTSHVYIPVSSAQEAVSIYFYQDGMRHRLTGARGTFSLSMKRNEIPVIKYEMTGLYNEPIDTAIVTPTTTAFQTPKVVNQANTTPFTIHGYAGACLDEFNFDVGNEIVFRNLVNCAEQVLLTDRAPKGSLSMEAVKIADKNWWTVIQAATLAGLDITHGTVAGNKVQFVSNNTQITNPQFSEQDKIVMLGADLLMIPTSAGNDEFTLTFK